MTTSCKLSERYRYLLTSCVEEIFRRGVARAQRRGAMDTTQASQDPILEMLLVTQALQMGWVVRVGELEKEGQIQRPVLQSPSR